MPTYSYTCLACDIDLDRMTKIDVRDDQVCEKCGNRLNRNITRPGLVWAPTAGGYR